MQHKNIDVLKVQYCPLMYIYFLNIFMRKYCTSAFFFLLQTIIYEPVIMTTENTTALLLLTICNAIFSHNSDKLWLRWPNNYLWQKNSEKHSASITTIYSAAHIWFSFIASLHTTTAEVWYCNEPKPNNIFCAFLILAASKAMHHLSLFNERIVHFSFDVMNPWCTPCIHQGPLCNKIKRRPAQTSCHLPATLHVQMMPK